MADYDTEAAGGGARGIRRLQSKQDLINYLSGLAMAGHWGGDEGQTYFDLSPQEFGAFIDMMRSPGVGMSVPGDVASIPYTYGGSQERDITGVVPFKQSLPDIDTGDIFIRRRRRGGFRKE